MNIGLIAVDSDYPNLALMKISARNFMRISKTLFLSVTI